MGKAPEPWALSLEPRALFNYHPPVPSLVIVDDEPGVLRPLTRYLSEHGYEVSAFDDFEAARQAIGALRPDVVVTDVRLGAFNGLQLAMIAREVRPDAQVLVMSGFDDPVLKAEAQRLGAAYLVKPVAGRTLVEALTTAASG